ncbi:unnamed protein product [Closterium sp. NIES-54]
MLSVSPTKALAGEPTSHEIELSKEPIKGHKFGGSMADCIKLCKAFALEVVTNLHTRMYSLKDMEDNKLYKVESRPDATDRRERRVVQWLDANARIFLNRLPEGAAWASAIGAWGASASGTVTTGGWGTAEPDEGELTQEELEEAEREMKAERGEESPRVVIPLGRSPRTREPPRSSHRWSNPWSEIEEGNIPPNPPRDSLSPISRPDPFARFIEGTTTPLTVIPDREFLALYLSTAPAKGETTAEAEAKEPDNEAGEEEEPPLHIPQLTEAEVAEHYARYKRTSGIRAEDDLWHQRLGHLSRQTLTNCLRAKVFPPGALLRPDGTEPHNTSHPNTCTVCSTAALSHSAYPSLEPSTNRYKKLEKVYSDFIVLTFDGINGEKYTLTFIDAYSRHVWVTNVDARSKAPEVFRIFLAHAQRQSGRKLMI